MGPLDQLPQNQPGYADKYGRAVRTPKGWRYFSREQIEDAGLSDVESGPLDGPKFLVGVAPDDCQMDEATIAACQQNVRDWLSGSRPALIVQGGFRLYHFADGRFHRIGENDA